MNSWDENRRTATLLNRGLDFADADAVFDSVVATIPDLRKDYEEPRYITVGLLNGRHVVVVWTPRGSDRRIISMRKANAKEIRRLSE